MILFFLQGLNLGVGFVFFLGQDSNGLQLGVGLCFPAFSFLCRVFKARHAIRTIS
jgi:hypothetical protein